MIVLAYFLVMYVVVSGSMLVFIAARNGISAAVDAAFDCLFWPLWILMQLFEDES